MENKEIKNNNGIILGVMAFIIIVLAGLCIYLLFIKKDEGVVDNNGNQQSNNIEIIKHVNCYVGDLYLDSKGAVYFSLSSEVINNGNLKQLRDKQTEYVNIVKNNNYNSDSLVGISLGQLNVKDVDYLQDGQGGYGYFTLLTKDSRLYLISDEAIEQNGIIEVIKPNKLHDIVSVGVESNSGDGAMSYALNKNNEKIYLYDVVDNINNKNNYDNTKYNPVDFDELINKMKKETKYFDYNITSDKLPRELDFDYMDKNYQVVLSNDGKVTIKKEDSELITLTNITNAKNIDYCNDMYVRFYILLNNGDVYEYVLDDFENKKYIATKINEIRGAEKFVKIDWADCEQCGGNTNLGVIDKENRYIDLDTIGS